MKNKIKKISALLQRSTDNLIDAKLVAAFRNGESKCIVIIFERHKKRLRPYLYHLLHSTTLVNDAMQETFIAAWSEIRSGQYHEEGDFTGWLNPIAYKQAMRILRTEHHYVHPKEGAPAEPQEESPAVPLMDEEEKKFLLRLLDKLPAQAHKILHMVFISGMSVEQVSQALHLKPDSVRHCMRRALGKLQALLVRKYGSSYSSLRIT